MRIHNTAWSVTLVPTVRIWKFFELAIGDIIVSCGLGVDQKITESCMKKRRVGQHATYLLLPV